MVERLDTRGTGVALLAHSMGNKTAQYFFEYAKAVKGQEQYGVKATKPRNQRESFRYRNVKYNKI
eukprot:292656-Amphidinium_carterae.1